MAQKIGCDDNIAVWMGAASKIRWRFFRFRNFGDVGCHRSGRNVTVRLRTGFCGSHRGCLRLRTTDQCHWWRIAQVVQRVAGCTEKLPCLRRCHDRSSDNGRMSFKGLERPLVPFNFWLSCGPYIRLAILTATYYILSVIAKRSMYLTA